MDAYHFLFQHGIMGDNPSAKWMGLNEYFRDNTPPTAKVLALMAEFKPGETPILMFDSYLRSRSGKTMVAGPRTSFHFDYPKLMKEEKKMVALDSIWDSWKSENTEKLKANLQVLDTPDYLVVPASVFDSLNKSLDFGYKEVAQINRFIVFKNLKAF